ISRILSSRGTNVPGPRTWRSSGPRLTVSVQIVARSTTGAAGFNRTTKNATTASTTIAAAPKAICRRSFFFRISGLEMSIATLDIAFEMPKRGFYFQILTSAIHRAVVHRREHVSVSGHPDVALHNPMPAATIHPKWALLDRLGESRYGRS